MPITDDQSKTQTIPANNTADDMDFEINLDPASGNVETTPIDINQTSDAKNEPELEEKKEDLSLDLPDSYFVEEKKDNQQVGNIVDPNTKKEEKIEQTVEEGTDNSRLQEQDQKNKEEEKTLFSPNVPGDVSNGNSHIESIAPEVVSQIENIKDNISKLEPVINVDPNQTSKLGSFDIGKTDYNSDMKIIENISGSNPLQTEKNFDITTEPKSTNTEVILEKTTTLETPIQNNYQNNNIDLDTLIAGNISNQVSSEQPEKKEEKTEIFPNFEKKDESNTISGSETKDAVGINPNLVTNTAESDHKENKVTLKNNNLLKFLIPAGVIAVLGVLGYFVVTTMYPVETGNIIEEAPQIAETTTGLELTGMTEDLSGSAITGDSSTMSGEILTDENNSGTISEEVHGSSPESVDSLGEINGDLASQSQVEEQSMNIKLKAMATEANTFFTEGQNTNNKVYIKYGGTIEKKCNELISMLENGQEIDNLTGNLAQLEGYLQKLRDIKNAGNQESSSQPVQQEIINDTGGEQQATAE